MIDARRAALLALAALACAIGSARGASAGRPSVAHRTPVALAAHDGRVHSSARDEWWSLHGELHAASGARFAFHTTFFRYGLGREAALHAAVASILDERTGRSAAVSRVARTRESGLPARDIRVDDWSFASAGGDGRIDVAIGDRRTRLALVADPLAAPVPSPAASGYAIVRLRARGVLTSDGRRVAVRGDAWLDHEYEVAGPPPRRVGQDRFELVLDDGRAIELVAPRLDDGRYGPFNAPDGERDRASQPTGDGPTVPVRGFVRERDGRVRALRPEDARLVVRGDTRWHSPHDDATYPALWQLSVRGFPPLALAPLARDQEFVPRDGGLPVWIGAIDVVRAELPGEPLGHGSVELTGYASATR